MDALPTPPLACFCVAIGLWLQNEDTLGPYLWELSHDHRTPAGCKEQTSEATEASTSSILPIAQLIAPGPQ